MSRLLLILVSIILGSTAALAEDETAPAEDTPKEDEAAKANGDGISNPKTMSGMSILGNEETPKSLVIVPWKSSEMGDAISLSDTLDDRARPVDKEVFLRELRYYEIRKSEH
jgi:hypothetical protein